MSKWDKLLEKICSLSRDLRFDELRRVLESYGYTMNALGVAAATTHFENPDAGLLRYRSMNRSRRFMWKW